MSVAFRTYAIVHMAKAARSAFEANYDAIMDGQYHKSLLKDSAAGTFAGACKSIGQKYVYSSPQTLKLELMGRRVIWDLLDLFWEAGKCSGYEKPMPEFARRSYELMSRNYREVCEASVKQAEQSGIPADYYRMQLVTDHVCGMTDTFAVTLHRELMNG